MSLIKHKKLRIHKQKSAIKALLETYIQGYKQDYIYIKNWNNGFFSLTKHRKFPLPRM